MAASLQLTLVNVIEIKQKLVYSVRFCSILPAYKKHFAVVGMNNASIYCIGSTPGSVELVQAYTDSDTDENYYVSTLNMICIAVYCTALGCTALCALFCITPL